MALDEIEKKTYNPVEDGVIPAAEGSNLQVDVDNGLVPVGASLQEAPVEQTESAGSSKGLITVEGSTNVIGYPIQPSVAVKSSRGIRPHSIGEAPSSIFPTEEARQYRAA